MTEQERPTDTPPTQVESAPSSNNSALRDNIARKGKHAYYFAHAHRANGPEWDGKEEPKLLSKTASMSVKDEGESLRASKGHSTFDFKSNITSYAFSDEGSTVKLYITMEGVGEKCTDDDISLDFTPTSFCFMVRNYTPPGIADDADATPPPPQCLSFLKLTADISKATYKKKKDRVVVILHKADEEKEWHTINDKGTPDHELV